MIKVGPCKGCEERRVGCHAECEKYKKWLDEYHAEQEEIFKEKHPIYRQYVNGKRGR